MMTDGVEQDWFIAFKNGQAVTIRGVRWSGDGCGLMWLLNAKDERVIFIATQNLLYYRPMETPVSNAFPKELQLALKEMADSPF